MEGKDKRKKIEQSQNNAEVLDIPFGGICGNLEDFFEKQVNEEFAATILQSVFCFQSVRHGQDGMEADLVFDEKYAFEITLICDKKKHTNLIQRLLRASQRLETFHSDDIEGEILSMLEDCVAKKANKQYANNELNLCLIVPFPMVSWIDGSMDVIEMLFVTPKSKVFRNLQDKYLQTKKLKNIYILFPDIDKSWWVIDLKQGKWQYKETTSNMTYPYFEAMSIENLKK